MGVSGREIERSSQPFKQRICGAKNAVDDVEIASRKFGRHVGEEIHPVHGKVVLANDGDRIAQLPLHCFR